jgi:hypothetical protein
MDISQQAHDSLAMVGEALPLSEELLPCEDALGADIVDTTPVIEPVVVAYTPTKTIAMKTEEVVHKALDAKLKDPMKLEADLEQLDLMRWAKFVSCLKEKQVKVETSITGNILLGMFPVAVRD